jgi:O-antigen ligase
MNYNYFVRGVDPFTGYKIERLTATGANPNGIAICLVISINFAFYLATRPGKKGISVLKLAYWGVFMAAAAVGVVTTGSRSGVLALVASVGLTSLTLFRGGWKPAAVFIFCLGAAVYVIPRVVPESDIARVQEGTQAGSFQKRVELWDQSIHAWRERPLLGIGSGATSDVAENVSHNSFISVLTENGLVGLVIFVSFWAILAVAVLSLQRAEKILWITMCAGYAPHLLSASAEYQKTLWFMFGLILAQTLSVANVKMRRGAGRLAVQGFRPNAA